MKRYGISNLSIVPVRSEPRETSEMCTQILFGEHYTIMKEVTGWCRIMLASDGYEGWIDLKMVNEVKEKYYLQLVGIPQFVTTEVTNIVHPKGSKSNFLILAGSTLPNFNKATRTFRIGRIIYKIKRNTIPLPGCNVRKIIGGNALMYLNSPYLWGGRSPFGIDCSGFSQVLYKMAGIAIPRNAGQQARLGENVTFVEETLPGDLAFFDNDEGVIIHVGIIFGENKIIHSSGRVRIDKIDHFGIFNTDTGRYTHQLRLMRRLVND
jgi:hypothetical protein